MKETTKLFLTKHKCKLCICTYCPNKKICKFKYYKCKYVCTYKPHIDCGAKEFFGIYQHQI